MRCKDCKFEQMLLLALDTIFKNVEIYVFDLLFQNKTGESQVITFKM